MPAKQDAHSTRQDEPANPPQRTSGAAVEDRNATTQDAPANNGQQRRDYAQALTAAITTTLARHTRTEVVIVKAMQDRADLYEKAFVQTKQALIDATNDVPAPERRARQEAALHTADVQMLPPATLTTLAALDARDYRALRAPQRQAEAAQVIAETVRLDERYRVALAEQAPNLAQVVQIVAAVTDKGRVANAPTTTMHSQANQANQANQAESSVSPAPTLTLDPSTLEQLAAKRRRDVTKAATQLSLNEVEPVTNQARRRPPEPEQQQRPKDSSPAKTKPSVQAQTQAPNTNQVTSDEVFTATKEDAKPIVPLEVESKYLRVGNKFYHPKNTKEAAFVDKGNQLQTRSDSEQIAATMVAIARARGWDEIKVAGSEAFRKEVWREATAQGMHVKGYTPTDLDQAELARRNPQIPNQVERDGKTPAHNSQADRHAENGKPHKDARSTAQPTPDRNAQASNPSQDGHSAAGAAVATARAQAFAQLAPAEALNAHPELAGAYAAKTVIEKKAAADGLSPQQSAIVMARVEASLINSIARGELPQMKMREQVELRRERTEKRELKR